MELMCNAEIILTKNKIMQKAWELLEGVQSQMLNEISVRKPHNIFNVPPKISKGENYLGLPYLVLDYPRLFSKEDSFAVRTMFWWGNFFSSTLYLSGESRLLFDTKIANAYSILAGKNYYLGVNTDPWAHHFEETNYATISSFTEEQFRNKCGGLPHIKIAAKWPLRNWPHAATDLLESWNLLAGICLD